LESGRFGVNREGFGRKDEDEFSGSDLCELLVFELIRTGCRVIA
jgi:hypothetical protein